MEAPGALIYLAPTNPTEAPPIGPTTTIILLHLDRFAAKSHGPVLGPERSSIATARSSIASDRQNSLYSRDPSRDRLRERDGSPDTIQTSEIAEEDEYVDPVGDVLDSYYYDEEDEERSPIIEQGERDLQSPSPVGLDSEPPELSQTPSRDFDSLDSFQSNESLNGKLGTNVDSKELLTDSATLWVGPG
ncbi:unnamed protein product [Alternaria alternata]